MRNFVGKPKGKRPLERRWCGWEDIIKMNPKERSWEGVTGFSCSG